MSDPADNLEDEPVLGPVPTLPDSVWDDFFDRTFAADPDDADDSLIPDQDAGDPDDVAVIGEDVWDDAGTADEHGFGSDPSDDGLAGNDFGGHDFSGHDFGGHDAGHHGDPSLDGLL